MCLKLLLNIVSEIFSLSISMCFLYLSFWNWKKRVWGEKWKISCIEMKRSAQGNAMKWNTRQRTNFGELSNTICTLGTCRKFKIRWIYGMVRLNRSGIKIEKSVFNAKSVIVILNELKLEPKKSNLTFSSLF